MFMTGARAFLFAVVVCGGMLTACDGAPEQPAATATKQGAAPKPAGLAPDMVAAVSSEKTAVMLGMHFALRAPPTVNQPLPIDIVIVPHRNFTALRAHFESHDGLAVDSGEVLGPLTDAPLEQALKHQLTVTPNKEGVFVISVTVETAGADGTVTRFFSIPVIVAPPDSPGTPAASATPTQNGAAAATK